MEATPCAHPRYEPPYRSPFRRKERSKPGALGDPARSAIPLSFQPDDRLEVLVRRRDARAVRLEGALRGNHLGELVRQRDVRLFERACDDGAEPAGIRRSDLGQARVRRLDELAGALPDEALLVLERRKRDLAENL